jgi:hypothetical protein
LSNNSSPFCFSYLSDRVLSICWGLPYTVILLPIPPYWHDRLVCWDEVSLTFCQGCSNLCLVSSWDYRHEVLCLIYWWKISQLFLVNKFISLLSSFIMFFPFKSTAE